MDLILKNGSRDTYYFVIMKNFFRTKRELHLKFDLKGSTYKRRTKTAGLSESKLKYITLKDVNWREMAMKFRLDEKSGERLSKVLRSDSEFLAGIGIIDYSLLVGVHYTEESEKGQGRVDTEGDDFMFSPKDGGSGDSVETVDTPPADSPFPESGGRAGKGRFSFGFELVDLGGEGDQESVTDQNELSRQLEQARRKEIEVKNSNFLRKNF